MAIRVFIGSSKEQRQLAEWLTAFMTSDYHGRLTPIPWYDNAYWPGGRYTLENLLSLVDSSDAAVLFWTADDKTWYRGTEVDEPRDNLTFEAGLFIAALGRDRTQLLIPDYKSDDVRKQVKIPSDLKGLTFNLYPWRDGSADSTGLPNRARSVCDGLALLAPRTRAAHAITELIGRDGIEEICSCVGEWRSVHINGIARLAERPDVRMIDVLAAYRVGEITRSLGMAFRKRPEVQLRACFANMWDKELFNIYHRKYYDRSEDHVKNGVKDSISKLIGPCDFDDATTPGQLKVNNLTSPPAGDYQLRLTSQRITYGYYRIDNCAFIVPLDMKRDQNPAPYAWVLPRESAPKAFDFYLQEYDRMFAEAMSVYS